jgi:Phosphodiester glycosidase
MSYRSVIVCAAFLTICGWPFAIEAEQTVTRPHPGITHIFRTETSPRPLRMNIILVDLTAPEIRFKLTPPGENLPDPLPPPALPPPGWPLPSPPYETVKQGTLEYLEAAHAQVAVNSHFFAPFPVPAAAISQAAYAYLIGLAASRGNVYSAFETPFQIYALVPDSPAINIDSLNRASIVHRDPNFADGKHVLENVQLWNAFAGSGQIVTNGVKTIPEYRDATHPNAPLIGPGPANYSNSNSWYNLLNARTAIGLTQDNRTLVIFAVDVRPNTGPSQSGGMSVGEVADLLIAEYGVFNALNMDGGGSTTLAMQDPTDRVRRVINTPSDAAPGRSEGSNLAVYSDGVLPVTTAVVSPAANANGWNKTNVTVTLNATDLASGITDTPPGWVDQVQYSLAAGAPKIVPGNTTSFGITTEGVTNVTYFATDAAGNEEVAKTLAVRLDGSAPTITGLPDGDCSVWPPTRKMVRVALLNAADTLSGVAPGSLQVKVTSNEPSDPNAPDAVVVQDGAGLAVELRADRSSSGSGRVYTLTATATDLADNVRTMTTTCTVPHDQRKK